MANRWPGSRRVNVNRARARHSEPPVAIVPQTTAALASRPLGNSPRHAEDPTAPHRGRRTNQSAGCTTQTYLRMGALSPVPQPRRDSGVAELEHSAGQPSILSNRTLKWLFTQGSVAVALCSHSYLRAGARHHAYNRSEIWEIQASEFSVSRGRAAAGEGPSCAGRSARSCKWLGPCTVVGRLASLQQLQQLGDGFVSPDRS